MQIVEAKRVTDPTLPPVPPDMYVSIRPHWAGENTGWIWISSIEEVGGKTYRTDAFARARAEADAARHPGAFVVFVPGGAR